MKKLLALALAAAMTVSLVACGGNTDDNKGGDAEGTYKTGLGVYSSYSLTPYTEEAEKGTLEIDSTIAVVTVDAEGKVVQAKLDVAQQKATIDGTGAVTGEIDTRTKVQKGFDYGMVKYNSTPIGKELFEQLEAFEEWMVGKTAEEILGVEIYAKDEEHDSVPADEDLAAGVTINVGDYLKALEKAFANLKETAGVPAKTGLGVVVEAAPTDAKVLDDGTTKDGSVQITTNIVAAAFDAEGKAVAVIIDAAQQKIGFTTEAVFDETVFDARTKVEKGDDYHMVAYGNAIAEIDAQYASLADWMTGKTVEEILGVETYERDEEHNKVPAVEELKSSVTITIGQYQEALALAAENAK